MFKIWNNLIIVLVVKFTIASAPTEVLFLILSQDTSFHRQLGANLRSDIIEQSHTIRPDYVINVRLLHEIFNQPGDWTVLAALPHLTGGGEVGAAAAAGASERLVNDNTKWIILCEDSTRVASLHTLLDRLSRLNHTEAFYLGHPLYDHEPTIIHHFAFFENPRWFPYPMLRSGVVFTAALLQRMAALVVADNSNNNRRMRPMRTDFAIDASHELARFIWDNVRDQSNDDDDENNKAMWADERLAEGRQYEGFDDSDATVPASVQSNAKHLQNTRKMILKSAPYICPTAAQRHYADEGATATAQAAVEVACAMYAKPMDTATCRPANRAHVYFAIKTCQKFHQERIPIIEATWAPYAIHKTYYSDVADAAIPTVSAGVPNSEVGHCAKTLAILKLALKDIERLNRHLPPELSIRWIFLADDDTLLSVSGVCELLGCFDPLDDIYLGERYGYRVHAPDGFNYITAGGGIALSVPVVRRILQQCSCPSPSAPDDMILGACLHAQQVRAIHSARFHQARPNDYARELLHLEPPITFHKFWQLDPLAAWAQWFATADRQLLRMEALRAQSLPKLPKTASNVSIGAAAKLLTHCRAELSGQLDEVIGVAGNKQFPFPVAPDKQYSKARHLDL